MASISNELTSLKDRTVWQSEIDGHLVTTRMYGPILAAVPFYWLNSYDEEADFSIYRAGMAAAVSSPPWFSCCS